MDNITTALDVTSLDTPYVAASTKKLSKVTIVLLLLAAFAVSCELVCRFAIGLGIRHFTKQLPAPTTSCNLRKRTIVSTIALQSIGTVCGLTIFLRSNPPPTS